MKSGRDDASVKPQVLEQSYNKPENCSLIWINDFSKSSKMWRFLSCHNVHIKQSETRFQTPEKCLPNQLCQPKSKSITLAGITQWIPKVWKTKNHKAEAISQCRRRWSPISQWLLHIQHQPAKTCPLLIKLSQVRILPLAAVHTKKEIRRGALTPQMPFHGNFFLLDPCKAQ